MKQLYPFQQTGVDFLASRTSALLADQMGTGKTVQAISALNKVNAKKTLILTPASVKYVWAEELPFWFHEPLAPIQIVNSFKTKIDPDATHIICNYDYLTPDSAVLKQLKSMMFDALICDEAHYLKNTRAKRTRAVLMAHGLIHRAQYRWMLSGTPVMNRPVELYPMLMGLRRDLLQPWDNWYSFVKRYCAAFQDSFGGWNVRGASNIPDLAQRLQAFMLRRTKAEVLPFLPAKQIQIVPLGPIQKFIYSGPNVDTDSLYAQMADMSTLRRETALAKMPACIEHIENVAQSVSKIVVFFYHREVFQALHAQWPDANYIYGGMTAEMKKFHSDQFIKNPDKQFIFVQFVSGGQGIDGWQRVCDTAIFVEASWNPAEIEQAVDRLHRVGQTNAVLAQILVLRKSLEEVIMREAKRKIDKVVNPLLTTQNTGGGV
jgi:SWI/SNF-related matrix-associated actin-dependent regulator 1 of chromatin subfamily A